MNNRPSRANVITQHSDDEGSSPPHPPDPRPPPAPPHHSERPSNDFSLFEGLTYNSDASDEDTSFYPKLVLPVPVQPFIQRYMKQDGLPVSLPSISPKLLN